MNLLLQMLFIAWIIFQVYVGLHLVFPLLLLIFSGLSTRKKYKKQNGDAVSYAIIVTAYEQTDSLPSVVNSILQLNYSNYIIYIVADKCDVSNLKFDDERVVVFRPEETLSSNTRSHFYAIQRFKVPHERLTIIDSDNLVVPSYLDELNQYFDKGYSAVQGVRNAKNLDTPIACIDAARDIYYHFYDGMLLFRSGSSATLAGSGMAFTTQLYRQCLEHLDITGAGFDKVLQAEIVKRNYRIAFAENAIVFDEKTTKSEQLVNQRARWINSWFRYFYLGFIILFRGIFSLSWNQFLFGIVLVRPPLFIMLGLSGLLMIANLFIQPWISLCWAISLLAFIAGFAIALASSHTDNRIYKSLKNIPRFIFLQFVSLLNARKANKRSVATRHYHTGGEQSK